MVETLSTWTGLVCNLIFIPLAARWLWLELTEWRNSKSSSGATPTSALSPSAPSTRTLGRSTDSTTPAAMPYDSVLLGRINEERQKWLDYFERREGLTNADPITPNITPSVPPND